MRFLRYIVVIGAVLLLAFLVFPSVSSDGAIPIRVTATVVDSATHEPIEGARIALMSARNNRQPELFQPPKQAIGFTDGSGIATVWDHFPAGWSTFRGGVILEGATIAVTADGYEADVQPVSDKKRIRYWTFWRPSFSMRFTLIKKNA